MSFWECLRPLSSAEPRLHYAQSGYSKRAYWLAERKGLLERRPDALFAHDALITSSRHAFRRHDSVVNGAACLALTTGRSRLRDTVVALRERRLCDDGWPMQNCASAIAARAGCLARWQAESIALSRTRLGDIAYGTLTAAIDTYTSIRPQTTIPSEPLTAS